MTQVIAQQLWFTDIHTLEVRSQTLPPLKPGELLIQTQLSAVSAGTELLVYLGQIPTEMALDASLAAIQQKPAYPLQYGYASVGRVIQVGSSLDAEWLGKRVFAFQPHASHFIATPANLIPVPEDISAQNAVFLANMETAVNLVQDGSPGLGEQVVVLGQGIVGLLLAGVLAQYPLAQLVAVDAIAHRRQQALQLGATQVFDPFDAADIDRLKQELNTASSKGADLIYEVSGTPDALNLGIELSGFASRLVIGSWYGSKSSPIALGGHAHRNRLKIITSQVSSIAPELTGRWDKTRRFAVAWEMIRRIKPEQWLSHNLSLGDAPSLYQQLQQNPGDILQAVFTYDATNTQD